jgi:peroxiredoxin
MAETPSTMAPLGMQAPHFNLPDPKGDLVSIDDFKDAPALLVMFICNHCPYVKHIRATLAQFGREYQKRNVAIVAINSNDVKAYPADRPFRMGEEIREAGYTFPYLFDETQEVAKAYHAACTPDFFLFDRDRRLVYRGQFDDSRPGSTHLVTGSDLRAAVDRLLTAQPPLEDQKASLGCNIKWKPGNAPSYFGD